MNQQDGMDELPEVPRAAIDALIQWYRHSHRSLPWRETRDPYKILVSEVMLQQTQAERVVPKYLAFLERFPTVAALADSPASEVIRAWAGLGYNRRALNLQRACQAAMERYDGELPDSVEELRSLPGVGPYTAGAIACFAFGQDVGFVDTNIRRVLHRIVFGPELPVASASAREIETLADRSVPTGKGYLWNQALMELGATTCRARSATCLVCPVSKWCKSAGRMTDAFAQARDRDRPAQVPFEQTSRYFRGRIIDHLRTAPRGLTAADLARKIDPERDLDNPVWTDTYLVGLLKDGLVITQGSALRESSSKYDGTADDSEERYLLPE